MILLSNILKNLVTESLTYNQLFQSSTLFRKRRARGMRVQKMKGDANQDQRGWNFGFRSSQQNNTTGKTWNGRITFLKNDVNRNVDDLPCEVDCGCPDYKYRFAYSNSQQDASPIGQDSLNQSNGSPSDVTNPKYRPGLCKHLLALKNDLHKRLSQSKGKTQSDKLNEISENFHDVDITVEE